MGLRPGLFKKTVIFIPSGGYFSPAAGLKKTILLPYRAGVLLLGLRPGCFLKRFFYPPGGGLVLGLRPGCLRCAAAVGFAYRRVTFLCDKKVTKKTPSGAPPGARQHSRPPRTLYLIHPIIPGPFTPCMFELLKHCYLPPFDRRRGLSPPARTLKQYPPTSALPKDSAH